MAPEPTNPPPLPEFAEPAVIGYGEADPDKPCHACNTPCYAGERVAILDTTPPAQAHEECVE